MASESLTLLLPWHRCMGTTESDNCREKFIRSFLDRQIHLTASVAKIDLERMS